MKFKIFVMTIISIFILSSVSVMAAPSPTAAPLYFITVNGEKISNDTATTIQVNGGSISVSAGSVKEGSSITLTAKAKKGKQFSKWSFKGDYTIVKGSAKSSTITIMPKSDVDIDATFVAKNGTKTTEKVTKVSKSNKKNTKNPKPGNTSNTSPKTGIPVLPFALTFIIALGCSIVSVKKVSES